jgi:hypothetical protein
MLTQRREGAKQVKNAAALSASAPLREIRFLLIAAIGAIGCTGSSGPKTAPVSGTVTLAGKPLADVGVTFLPEGKGPSASGNTDAAGNFTLRTNKPGDGAPLGKHRVVIGNAQEGPRKGPAIPEKYGRYESSDLAAEVKPGEKNVFTFDLKP